MTKLKYLALDQTKLSAKGIDAVQKVWKHQGFSMRAI